MKSKRKLLIWTLAVVLLFSFSMFLVSNRLFVTASAKLPDIQVVGASARVIDSDEDTKTVDGIRFHIQIKTSVLNNITSQSNAKIAALLCPAEVLGGNDLTSNANSSVIEAVLYEKINNTVITNVFNANNVAGDYTETTCAIKEFPDNDFSKELKITCRAFYQIANNDAVYSENCTRSLEYVAASAYNDNLFDPIEDADAIATIKNYLVNYYEINFNTNGGNELPSKFALSGEQTIDFLNTVPTREGYEFIRWEKESLEISDVPTNDKPVRNVLNLKAVWRQTSVSDSTYNLISNGQSSYSIYTASSDEKVVFAAKEMQDIIKKATGVTLPIVETATAPYISLGVDESMVSVTGDNGYDISLNGQNVVISGTDAVGVVFGVYKFLNLQFNYVYYANNTVSVDMGVTNEKLLAFNDYEYAPALPNVYGLTLPKNEEEHLRLLNSNSQAIKPLYYGHSHLYWLPLSEYEEAHPSWYYTKDENVAICLTNAEVIAEMAKVIGEKLEETEDVINVMLSAGDHRTICQCEDCLRSDAEYTHAGTDILFANAVAQELEKAGYYNFRLVTLAYYETVDPPIDPYTGKALVKAHDKVAPLVCFAYSDCSSDIKNQTVYGSDGQFKENPMALIDGWSKVSNNINCWIYQGYLDKYKMMFVDELPYLQSWLTAIYGAGIKNDFNFVEIENANMGIFKELNVFCQTQLAYDTTLNVDTLIENFMNNYYGVAGQKMLEVYNSLINRINEYETSTGKNTVSVCWGGAQDGQKYERDLWTETYLNTFIAKCGEAYAVINNSALSSAEKDVLIDRVAQIELFGRYWKLKFYDTNNFSAQAQVMIDATYYGYDTTEYVMFDNMVAVNSALVEISTTKTFVGAMKYGKGNYKLTADIDMSGVTWHDTYMFNGDFSGTLDGQGYKVYGLTKEYKEVFEVYGIFNTISGTIKNVYIKIEDCAVISGTSAGKVKGFLANSFTGTMQDCIVDYNLSIGGGSEAYIATTGMFHTVENGTLTNIVMINRSAKDTFADFAPLITANATGMTAENIALISIDKVPYHASFAGLGNNFLSSTVNKGIKNVYVYTSIENAINGNVAYALDNTTYQGLSDGDAPNDADYWLKNSGSMKLSGLLTNGTFDFEVEKVYLCEKLIFDITKPLIKIGSAEEFVSAMTTDPAGNYQLTADIDMSSYIASNPWATTYIFDVNFSGKLDGQGYKIYGLNRGDNGDYNAYGIFNTISGTIKNVYIQIDSFAAYDKATQRGFIAKTFTGTMQDCVIDYNITVLKHGDAAQMTRTGAFYEVIGGTLNNIILINRSVKGTAADYAPLITASATEMTAENIALISMDKVPYNTGYSLYGLGTYFLSSTVNKGINNVYIYTSVENALNGTAAYELNNTTYQGLADGAAANATSYWTPNANKKIASLLENSNFTFEEEKVYLDEVLIFDVTVPATEIANATDFVNKITADPSGKYVLTADIDMSSVTWKEDHILNVNFSGTLDGQGHKIYGLTKVVADNSFHTHGIFNTISGTIKNVYIKIENCTVYKGATLTHKKGFLAMTFTGTMQDCVVDYKLSNSGSSYIKTAGMFYEVNGGTLKNIVIIDRNNAGDFNNYEPLIAVNATGMTAENIALICTGGSTWYANYAGLGDYFLSSTVNKGIKNVYVYNSIADAVSGTAAYALNNDTYQGLADGAAANATSYWTKNATKTIADLQSANELISVEGSQLKFNSITIE